jgi:6-phosphogluconolactonase
MPLCYVKAPYSYLMELVVAPIAELRPQITHLFEEVVSSTLDHGAGAADEPYTFTCGLTGGATALIFLGALREADVDWSRIFFVWGDERAVPPDHADSNFGLAERLLLSPLGARAPNALRMPADHTDVHGAARKYAAQLPEALDLLILGVGDDGHVCSLFPGHHALTTSDQRVTVVEDSPKPPPRRMTLTLPYVIASRRIWVVAVGPRKQALLQRAVSREDSSTPLELVAAQGRHVTIFTDQPLRQ